LIYSGTGTSPLTYRLSYTSRKSADLYRPALAHGLYWTHGLERRLIPDSSSGSTGPNQVSSRRADGKLYGYTRQANGSYLADADITDRLTRLTDAGGVTTGWRLIAAAGDEIETYDAAGKLASLTDRQGRTVTLAYDGSNRLATITDAYGHALTLAYDAQNRVATLTQPDGGIVHFSYDTANNLAGITWPDTRTRSYHYENASFPNNLTGITDENGARYATYGYDSQGRAILTEHAGGAQRATLSFGANSTTVTDALGTARTHTLTTVLSVVRGGGSTQPGGSGCGPAASAQTYDANGNIATRTDFNGNLTTYTYDLTRNLETRRIDASGTPEARTLSTQWHPVWRLPVKIAEPLKLTTLIYNGDTYNSQTVTCAPAGATVPSPSGPGTQPIGVLCQKIEQATTDSTGSQGLSASTTGTARTRAWTYDPYGQVLTADGPRTDVTDLTTTTYYPISDPDLGKRGNLATVTNALGHVTQITAYDANGRPLTVIDPNGLTTTLSYDARGRMTGKTVGTEATSYQYDGVGQLTVLTLPNGASLHYSYDVAHRLSGISDGLGNSITYTLDAMGNRTREDVKDPASQLSRTRQRAFDALNRLYQDIGAQNQTTTYAYDANGNLTGVLDPLNRLTANAYDALNRLVRITDPNNGQTSLGYNGQDRTVQVTDPRNLVTSYTVDGLGNLTQQVSPDTGTTQISVDAAGNPVSRTDAKGQTTATQYDALNRPTLITYQDGRQERYTWDQSGGGGGGGGASNLGRLTLIEELQGGQVIASTRYAYDIQGRVTGETRSEGALTLTTGYAWSNGDLISLTYPSGKQIAYGRDSQGRVSQITLTDNGVTRIVLNQVQYHPFGGVKSYVTGAGQTLTRSQDLDGRINAYTLGAGLWQIGYDTAGRIGYQTDSANATNTASYGYDSLDRLTGTVLPTTSLGYGYDATGNRTSQTIGGATYNYTVSPTSNRLSGINTVPPKSYAHDANGSVTGDGQNTFGYDARGRMTQAVTAAGTTQYRLDALGRRIAKTNATEDTRFVHDRAGHLISETDATGTAKREYLWLGDLPVGVLQ
jgi:YD repeat-containing protein